MKKIDNTKKLLIVLWNSICDHAFICGETVGYYDKGDQYDKAIAKHFLDPDTQVVFLADETDHDDTTVIFEEYLPNIIKGKKTPADYGFEVLAIFDDLEEWEDERGNEDIDFDEAVDEEVEE